MLVNVRNENYGCSVTTHNDWVVVGNPSLQRWDSRPASASFWKTGSLDVFKYNSVTDQHDLLATIYCPVGLPILNLGNHQLTHKKNHVHTL
jgi:hypothetical protein